MSLARTLVTDTVATVGGLLPYDLLERIKEGKEQTGSQPADYRLYAKGDSVRDAAERSWGYLCGVWTAYQDALARDGANADDFVHAVGLTRERWLLPLFEQLGFGGLAPIAEPGLPAHDETKNFPVSHRWEHVPVHLTGWNVHLDRRTDGRPAQAPQSMLQEYLNRSGDAALWGVVSNGRLLSVLRESASLTGVAYVEFDLEAIFEGNRSDDFVLLWRLLHRTRFEKRTAGGPVADCFLEKWRTEAIDSGTRALKALRKGVEEALEAIGTGLIAHPDNTALLDDLHARRRSVRDLHPGLLRLVYRLLFLFVTEDRGVLLDPEATPRARETYEKYFSTARLRRLAGRTGTAHGDQWEALRLVIDGLGAGGGRPELALPALGGLFEKKPEDEALDGLSLTNEALYDVVAALCVIYDERLKRPRKVDYRHLGADELGSVYESLLELEPRLDTGDRYVLRKLDGNDRKTSGSYYTPSPLIDCLLDSALDPVIDEAVRSASTRQEREDALLALTVCDPACGSGHFLVAAARRIARRLAEIRADDPEPDAKVVTHALRDVIGRCVYGVDLNHMAVELAKVSLWIEAMEPGRPLTFLDAHIKHGNGLLGTTPKLLAGGLPDDAFKPLEGDDRKWVTALKARNKAEREAWRTALDKKASQDSLFDEDAIVLADPNDGVGKGISAITAKETRILADVQEQARAYHELTTSRDHRRALLLANAWCAAFVWPKGGAAERVPALTTKGLLALHADPAGRELPNGTVDLVGGLADAYRFFHWHLEFPEVFRVPGDPAAPGVDQRTGWRGGFSCVLGNPPWERVKLQEQEFFATRDEDIAKAANKAERERRIDALANSDDSTDRELHAEFIAARRLSEGVSHLLRASGRFPLAGRGDVNTYAVFAETASRGIAPQGRFGLVLPTGIATDATTAEFFSDLVRAARLASFLDFENEAFILSRDVDHRVRFSLLTATGVGSRVEEASFAFGTRHMETLEERRFAMPPEEILLVNPNTGTLPVFRSRRDAEITLGIYRRVPVLMREPDADGKGGSNPWDLSFMTMFHMSNDSHLFRTKEQLEAEGWQLTGNIFARSEEEIRAGDQRRYLPLYEAKMFHHYDHRLGTYEGQTRAQANVGTLPRATVQQHDDPGFAPLPRYWVPEFDVDSGKRNKKFEPIMWPGVAARLAEREWWRGWLMGWRDVARSTDTRTMIGCPLPAHGVGHKFPLMFVPTGAAALTGVLSSYVFDYVVRQKVAGTSMTYGYVMQFPVPTPDGEGPFGTRLASWLTPRVLELTFTSRDMASFARDHGDEGAPFRWNEERRELIRAELDAAMFHIYGLGREDVEYVMGTFPTVRKRDEAAHGTYRTRDLILDAYDRMTKARATGAEYQTLLDPPPGKGPRHEVN
ncbi:DNA methyltransferase [Streptomyces sp. NPDC090032]|uniref:DNA methyltransferase n=1 Tax=Streptomyces sp. NPDC090032 TaxID=3365925 RepID=UPI0038278F51